MITPEEKIKPLKPYYQRNGKLFFRKGKRLMSADKGKGHWFLNGEYIFEACLWISQKYPSMKVDKTQASATT